MIIEFIGTPGAGKTTLMRVAAGSLNDRGYHAWAANDAARPVAARTLPGRAVTSLPAWLQRPLLWQLFYATARLERVRFYLRHSELVRRVWAEQRRRPLASADRRHVVGWFNHQTGVYEFMRRRIGPADAILFDEGFIHRAVQLFASERDAPQPAAVDAYVALLPRPDLLVYVAAPLAVCRRRVLARGLWARFAVKSPADTDRYLAAAEQAVVLAVAAARELGWMVVQVDNSADDPAPAAACLESALAAFVPAPPAAPETSHPRHLLGET